MFYHLAVICPSLGKGRIPCVEAFRQYFIVTIRIIGTKHNLIFFKKFDLPKSNYNSFVKKTTIKVKGKLGPVRVCLLHQQDLWASESYSYLYECVISALEWAAWLTLRPASFIAGKRTLITLDRKIGQPRCWPERLEYNIFPIDKRKPIADSSGPC
jgi:hypothetical protein